MTGLMRSRRIGGIAMAAALAASISVLAIGCVSFLASVDVASAQTPGTAGSISPNDLFAGEDSVVLTPDGMQKFRDAAQKAGTQGNCPRAKFTVVVKKGDPNFQDAFAKARRDALLSVLGDQARYFVFETDNNGAKNDVRVDYDVSRDTIAPTLNVTWTPPKNSKVKARDRITAKVIARDDANDWQTGIETIDLDV